MTLVVVTATSWMLPALHHTSSSSSSSNSELKIHHCHHVIAIAGVNVNRDKSGNFLLRRRRRWVLRNNPPNSNPTVEAEAEAPHMALDTASNVVRKFYDGINGRNLAAVEDLIADDCIYEDLVFPRPFVGRKAILEFFQKFVDSISADLQFVIDDISDEDTTAVGVTWHLELRGKPFPFSKGCSFYRCEVLNGQRKIR
ncbi:hypothetical protein RJ640_027742 [Escallonia rubra]|uniref:SnoaL-like domain-containing protein n=1 Tax=Escallonia rubra TaxID=112253 RepID=A0AA88QEE6_9ASTE|nr:hypothetical protein RJ640_027742 [Escallonia rubra]